MRILFSLQHTRESAEHFQANTHHKVVEFAFDLVGFANNLVQRETWLRKKDVVTRVQETSQGDIKRSRASARDNDILREERKANGEKHSARD